MKNRIIKAFLFFITFCTLNAQQEEFMAQKLPSIIPPSPNVAALAKFGNIPVNRPTGTPSINVPLYTISTGGFELPISVDYHASGIKVEEIGSSVGLGWALNAGGVITKTVRGGLDDKLGMGYLYNNGEVGKKIEKYANNQMNDTEKRQFQDDVSKGLMDTEPDIFTFSFLGYNGSFTRTPYGEIVMAQGKPIRIEEDGNGFVIIDPNGNKYQFYEKETTFSLPKTIHKGILLPYLDPTIGTSSWLLTKIELNTNREILFEYVGSTIEPEYQTTEIMCFRLSHPIPSCSDGTQSDFPIKYGSKSSNETEISQKKLSKISFDQGEVEFIYSDQERLDLPGDHALETIIIKDLQFEPIQIYQFQQEYHANRLYLKEIQEEGKDGTLKPPHIFEYDNPGDFPPRDSKAQDFWGFYNGKTSNTTLIPKSFTKFSNLEVISFPEGADRNPDSTFSKIGTLEKITYPTGGKSILKYENHQYGNFEGNKPVLDTIRTTSQENAYLNPTSDGILREKPFIIPFDQEVTVETNISGFGTHIRIIDQNGVPVYGHEGLGNQNPEVQNIVDHITLLEGAYKIIGLNYEEEFTVNMNVSYESESSSYSLEKNRYAGGLRIKTITEYNSNGTALKKMKYEYHLPQETDRSSGILVSQFTHEYLKYDSFVLTCGTFPTTVYAMYLVRLSTSAVPISYSRGSHVEYSDVFVYEHDLTGSADEISPENSNGLTHYKYTSSTTYHDQIFKNFPFLPSISKSYARGMPLEVNYFSSDGNDYTLVKKVENEYGLDYRNLSFAPVASIGFYQQDLVYPLLSTYTDNVSTYTNNFFHLKKTIVTDYGLSNQDPLTTVTEYSFENFTHLQPTKTETLDSKGLRRVRKTFYPDDVSSETLLVGPDLSLNEKQALDKLKALGSLHRIAEPVQIEVYLDLNDNGVMESDELQVLKRNNFKDWDTDLGLSPDNDFVLIENILTLKGQYNEIFNTTEERIVYHRYDDRGNPVEVSMTDGTHEYFLWGYHKEYPIARIHNLTFGEITTTIQDLMNDAIMKSDEDDGQCTDEDNCKEEELRDALKLLRDALPYGTLMTSYTYDPIIGITSKTDPRGNVEYFQYDTFNRLKSIKDQNGKYITDYKYHYSGQTY